MGVGSSKATIEIITRGPDQVSHQEVVTLKPFHYYSIMGSGSSKSETEININNDNNGDNTGDASSVDWHSNQTSWMYISICAMLVCIVVLVCSCLGRYLYRQRRKNKMFKRGRFSANYSNHMNNFGSAQPAPTVTFPRLPFPANMPQSMPQSMPQVIIAPPRPPPPTPQEKYGIASMESLALEDFSKQSHSDTNPNSWGTYLR